MPVTLVIHPCRTAREREAACRLERQLDLRRRCPSFSQAHAELQGLLGLLEPPRDCSSPLSLLKYHDEHDTPCATVFDRDRPLVTLTYLPE